MGDKSVCSVPVLAAGSRLVPPGVCGWRCAAPESGGCETPESSFLLRGHAGSPRLPN